MAESESKEIRMKLQLSTGLFGMISLLAGVLFFGDLSGYFGEKFIIMMLSLSIGGLLYIWIDHFKKMIIFWVKNKQNESVSKDLKKAFASTQLFQSASPMKQRFQSHQNQYRGTSQASPLLLNINYSDSTAHNRFQMLESDSLRNTTTEIPHRKFGQQNSPQQNFNQQQFASVENPKKEINRKSIVENRKWGTKKVQQENEHGLMGVASSSNNGMLTSSMVVNGVAAERRTGASLGGYVSNQFSQQQVSTTHEKSRILREQLFQESFKRQGEFTRIEQMESAIQRTKIYSFHILKEQAQVQLHNILQINRLLSDQFNIVLAEAEAAQGIVQELQNRLDFANSYKKRVTIDDLYHFKLSFEKSKSSIWQLPYDHKTNTDLIASLIELIEIREQLDTQLEVKGYNPIEIRSNVLTRLFFIYATQEIDEEQRKSISDKTPTDVEIVAHCLFLEVNEAASKQKDLCPCKIEIFESQSEQQTVPILGDARDKFYFLVCNRIGLEPYFMLQIGNTIFHSIPGPLSLFCTVIYYFIHMKNVVFPSLSHSKQKEVLETPAKYILNYEDYRKGFDRAYF